MVTSVWTTPAGATVDGPQVEEGRDDAAFFRDGNGADLVATVTLGRKAVSVYCAGEMRVHNLNNDERYVYASDLLAAGIRTDAELTAAEDRRDIEFVYNPWFEVEIQGDDGEGLDLIEGSYAAAILRAEDVLTNPDYDALFPVGDEVA